MDRFDVGEHEFFHEPFVFPYIRFRRADGRHRIMQSQVREVRQLAESGFARHQRCRSAQHAGVEHFGLHGEERVLGRADLQNIEVACRIQSPFF